MIPTILLTFDIHKHGYHYATFHFLGHYTWKPGFGRVIDWPEATKALAERFPSIVNNPDATIYYEDCELTI